MANTEIMGIVLKMADRMTSDAHKSYCREKAGIDPSSISDDSWVPIDTFNKYMAALAEKTSKWGPKTVGISTVAELSKSTGFLDYMVDFKEALANLKDVYSAYNKGTDIGVYYLSYIDDSTVKIETTSILNPSFHIGVAEGVMKYFGKMPKRSDITATLENDGKYVFEYTL
ncbi:MAG TPA: hypothetical protein PKV16_07270 [Caldisericia bacterium]|nr:hypothetical protein [Caldisericia bacterium]HPF49395.1 hypothetical protein [Caldisericia bacterium]HPI84402.1 hypothetical protein [Caldisericia bacterium]HPQ93566.1 hypothetical protein [Caldisericia bacterium]HRV75535.1 hypothetical protein [Caldisericia bacterium]